MKAHTISTILWRILTVILFAALLCLILILTSGCASAYRATSKPFLGYSSFSPTIIIGTNTYGRALCPPSSSPTRSDSLTAQADVSAPVIICAEQLYLSFWGGSASTNSVLSDIKIPLTGTP